MSVQQLKSRLLLIAIDELKCANKKQPFHSKSQAFKDLNRIRSLSHV